MRSIGSHPIQGNGSVKVTPVKLCPFAVCRFTYRIARLVKHRYLDQSRVPELAPASSYPFSWIFNSANKQRGCVYFGWSSIDYLKCFLASSVRFANKSRIPCKHHAAGQHGSDASTEAQSFLLSLLYNNMINQKKL